jgi:hypothetical protein
MFAARKEKIGKRKDKIKDDEYINVLGCRNHFTVYTYMKISISKHLFVHLKYS